MSVFADIRPGERRATLGAFLALFGILAAHTLLETARDALFLAKIPATRLPWTYLGIAFAALSVFALDQGRGRLEVRPRAFAVQIALSSLVTIVLWIVALSLGEPGLYALYIWSGLFATVTVVRFWIWAADYFSIADAKRLFPLIGAGSVAGSIAGALLARALTMGMAAGSLLIAAAICMVLTAIVPWFLPERPRDSMDPERRSPLLGPLRVIARAPYLKRVGLIVLVSTVVFTFVDYWWKSAVANHVPAEKMPAFFATAHLAFNVLALVAQLLLVRYLVVLVRVFKIQHMLSVVPALLAVPIGILLTGGGLVSAFLLKSVDGTLRHSLHRTTTEMLFVHLRGDIRAELKAWIDVVGQRGGQAGASILILVLVALGASPVLLPILTLLLVAVWIYLARSIAPHYLEQFRKTLNEDAIASRVGYPELDVSSLTALMRALNSRDDGEVIAAVELLHEQERIDVVPALLLYHPSTPVVVRALAVFASGGREDIQPILQRLEKHEDPEVRAAMLRARAWLAPDADLYRAMMDDPSPVVAGTATVGLLSLTGSKEARERLMAEIAEGNEETLVALARAIRYNPGASFADALIEIAAHGSFRVKREVADALREVRTGRGIPILIDMLAWRELRDAARSALVAIGPDALEHLAETLHRPWVDQRVHRHLPRTISRFRNQRAMDILSARLLEETDPVVGHKILRALGRLGADDSSLRISPEILGESIERDLKKAFHLLSRVTALHEAAESDPVKHTQVHELLVDLLEDQRDAAIERVFRVLGLLHPNEEVHEIYRGLASGRRDKRASGRELLENLLKPPLRDPLLAFLDDIPARQKLAQAGPYRPIEIRDYVEVLRALLAEGSTGARCLVVVHVGELRLTALAPALVELPSDRAGLVSRSVDRALTQLGMTELMPVGAS